MPNNERNPLQKAIDDLGPYRVAKLCHVRGPSVYKWRVKGRLPRTDYTGETRYADAIVDALKGTANEVSREALLTMHQSDERIVSLKPPSF